MFHRKNKSIQKTAVSKNQSDYHDEDDDLTSLIDTSTVSTASIRLRDEDEKMVRLFEETALKKDGDLSMKRKEIKRLNKIMDDQQQSIEKLLLDMCKRGIDTQSINQIPSVIDQIMVEKSNELKELKIQNNEVIAKLDSIEKIYQIQAEKSNELKEPTVKNNELIAKLDSSETALSINETGRSLEDEVPISVEIEQREAQTRIIQLEDKFSGDGTIEEKVEQLEVVETQNKLISDIEFESKRAPNTIERDSLDVTFFEDSMQNITRDIKEKKSGSINSRMFGRIFCFA